MKRGIDPNLSIEDEIKLENPQSQSQPLKTGLLLKASDLSPTLQFSFYFPL